VEFFSIIVESLFWLGTHGFHSFEKQDDTIVSRQDEECKRCFSEPEIPHVNV